MYRYDLDCSSYTTDHIFESWHTFSVAVRERKTLEHPNTMADNTVVKMTSVQALVGIAQVTYRLNDRSLMNAALVSLQSRCTDGRMGGDDWIAAISEVYAIVTDVQNTFAICDDSVGPLRNILLAAGVQHIDALLLSEKHTFEEALQASEFLRDDWSRALEWYYRDSSSSRDQKLNSHIPRSKAYTCIPCCSEVIISV